MSGHLELDQLDEKELILGCNHWSEFRIDVMAAGCML
jgi:hypothetical protein